MPSSFPPPLSSLIGGITSPQLARQALENVGDGINVTEYGGVYDGLSGTFLVSITNGSPNLTISTETHNVTMLAGSKTLSLTGAQDPTNKSFQGYDVGCSIAVAGAGPAGAVLISTITGITISGVTSTQVVTLADAASTALSNVSTALTWPCFRPSDVGKSIWISGAGPSTAFGGSGTGLPLLTTILAYVSPTQVTLAASAGNTIGNGSTSNMKVVWGTDNTNAITAARKISIANNKRQLNYEYSGAPAALCCAFGMSPGIGAISDALGNATHVGNNVSSFWTDSTGRLVQKQMTPLYAPVLPSPSKRLVARRDLPRFAAASSPIVVIWGDSMSTDSPSYSPSFSQITLIKNRLIAANPGKAITFLNYGIGGAIWDWLATIPPGPTWPTWYNDHTALWSSYPQAADPDLIILAESGVNDGGRANVTAMINVINQIKTNFTKSGGLAPDIIMVNNREATLVNDANYLTTAGQDNREQVSAVHRSFASANKIGFLDYHERAMLIRQGWAPTRMALQTCSQMKANIVSPTAPQGLGQRTRDFDLMQTFASPGAVGAAAIWANWGSAQVQIGSNPGNLLILGADSSSNLTYQVNTWGYTAASSASITSGAAVLTVGGTTSTAITGGTFVADVGTSGCSFTVAGAAPFTSGMVGQCIIIPSGGYATGAVTNYSDFRSQIIGFVNSTTVILADPLLNGSVGAVSIITGPILFHPNDAASLADIIVPGAGAAGANLVTKVATYTSRTQVTLVANAGTTLSTSTQSVFLGRISIPVTSSAILMASALYTTSPIIRVSRRGETLMVSHIAAFGAQSTSATASITNGSPNLSTVAAAFTPDMSGWPISIPGAGTSGAALASFIKTVVDSEHVVLNDNAGTTITSSAVTLSIGPSAERIAFEGPVEYFGGPFVPIFRSTNASPSQACTLNPKNQVTQLADFMVMYQPQATDLELWGTADSVNVEAWYLAGNGVNHDTTLHSVLVDGPVLDAQDWATT